MSVRVRRVTTTRAGGVSAPPYDTFNLGDHVGDDPAAVASNRKRLASAIGLSTQSVVWMNQVHGDRVQAEPQHYGPATLRLLQQARQCSPESVAQARSRRDALLPSIDELLAGVDVLIGPAVPYPAPEVSPPIDTPEGEIEGIFTGPYNVSGQPAIVVPCGTTADGLPVALQLASAVGDDAGLLRAAAAVEAALAVSS